VFAGEIALCTRLSLYTDQQIIFLEQNVKGVIIQLLVIVIICVTEAMFVRQLFANRKLTVA